MLVTMRLHLDTDLGSNIDDACALAMVLGWPDAELLSITTNLDRNGRRAGCVARCLGLAGRDDIPLAAGATAALTTLASNRSTWADRRYWPQPVTPRPSAPGDALTILADSARRGATVVALGACTNLALLAVARPGALDGVRVIVMGGWIDPPGPGLPQWGPARDTNIQRDIRAVQTLLGTAADLTLVPLSVTVRAQLRRVHLARLRRAGAIGALLARQAEVYAGDHGMTTMGRDCSGLADDLLAFHHDPVACAVALRWPGATVERLPLNAIVDHGTLRFRRDRNGRGINVATAIDADAFADRWLDSVHELTTNERRRP